MKNEDKNFSNQNIFLSLFYHLKWDKWILFSDFLTTNTDAFI